MIFYEDGLGLGPAHVAGLFFSTTIRACCKLSVIVCTICGTSLFREYCHRFYPRLTDVFRLDAERQVCHLWQLTSSDKHN
jgi:hypothetical protein